MSHFISKKKIDRRTMLRAAGVTMALPWLEAMTPALQAAELTKTPKRFVGISNALGFHSPFLFPTKSGKAYDTTRYLKPIDDLRDQFTVISGVSHPGVGGGHKAEPSILSGAPYSGTNFKNTISLDQLMAKYLGGETRYPSLALNSNGSSSTSYTENGSMIPPEDSPQKLFTQLFLADSKEKQRVQLERLKEGRSIMDIVGEEAKSMQRRLGAGDRDKLDAYFSSVRTLEKRLAMNEGWATRPKPKVYVQPPAAVRDNKDLIAHQTAMHDVIFLAIQTDSTRFITMHTNGSGGKIPLEGVDEGYHQLSHHGLDEDKINQLGIIEEAQMNSWGQLARKLYETSEGEGTLLDQTMLLLTSNLGNASAHDTKNMPVVFAGGGFKHGQHLAFNRQKNYPLPNLYVSMLQRMGLEQEKFAGSTGTMTGLEMT